jgi:Ribosomal subunit 39S
LQIFKRVTQLTGIRISDPALQSIKSVKALLSQILTPPKPAKLAEVLTSEERLASLPNVTIFDRRVTPIDKEMMVGRWKVIEKELERRGLPVTGHDLGPMAELKRTQLSSIRNVK